MIAARCHAKEKEVKPSHAAAFVLFDVG